MLTATSKVRLSVNIPLQIKLRKSPGTPLLGAASEYSKHLTVPITQRFEQCSRTATDINNACGLEVIEY